MSNLVLLADHPEGRLFWHASTDADVLCVCGRVIASRTAHVYKPDGAIHLCQWCVERSGVEVQRDDPPAQTNHRTPIPRRPRCSGAPSPVSPAAATDATGASGKAARSRTATNPNQSSASDAPTPTASPFAIASDTASSSSRNSRSEADDRSMRRVHGTPPRRHRTVLLRKPATQPAPPPKKPRSAPTRTPRTRVGQR